MDIKEIDPKDYYYNKFPDQLKEFIGKSHAHDHFGIGEVMMSNDLTAENFSHIPEEERVFFKCVLVCVVLIDQVMYAYFKSDYPLFRKITMYPKFEYGITGIMMRPWDIMQQGIQSYYVEKFFDFFIKDTQAFFEINKFEMANWEAVKQAMLNDKDAMMGILGGMMHDALLK